MKVMEVYNAGQVVAGAVAGHKLSVLREDGAIWAGTMRRIIGDEYETAEVEFSNNITTFALGVKDVAEQMSLREQTAFITPKQ